MFFFLKIAAPILSAPLTTIFNLSLSSSSFPDIWKVAKVSLLFKESSILDCSNFRAISVLSIISKVLVRHVHTSFYINFLGEHTLLTYLQLDFTRWYRFCELATLNQTDNILSNIDKGLLNTMLLIDLRKTFDLVDHGVLQFKLTTYGCSSSAYKLFASYLSGRSQKNVF